MDAQQKYDEPEAIKLLLTMYVEALDTWHTDVIPNADGSWTHTFTAPEGLPTERRERMDNLQSRYEEWKT